MNRSQKEIILYLAKKIIIFLLNFLFPSLFIAQSLSPLKIYIFFCFCHAASIVDVLPKGNKKKTSRKNHKSVVISFIIFFLCEIIFYIDFCLYSHPHLAYILFPIIIIMIIFLCCWWCHSNSSFISTQKSIFSTTCSF